MTGTDTPTMQSTWSSRTRSECADDPPTPVPGLPVASWAAWLPGLPRDDTEQDHGCSMLLRPVRPIEVSRLPEGPPVAVVPVEHLPGVPTWLPVIDRARGWLRVLLGCAPDGATGWVRRGPDIETRRHRTHLVVDTKARELNLWGSGRSRTWQVGVGRPASPTPRGRTMVLGLMRPDRGVVDLALVLATHAPTHLAHTVGIAALAVHTWPGAGPGRLADTDGCVLVPEQAMPVLAAHTAPGTTVIIR